MKQIYTFLFSILAFATFASAQIAQDTTYYTDEQGRTVVMIKQNQGTAPAAQQQNGAIQTSPEAALARLRRIQRHRIAIDGGSPVSGISTIDSTQASVLAALKVRKPTTVNEQLALL